MIEFNEEIAPIIEREVRRQVLEAARSDFVGLFAYSKTAPSASAIADTFETHLDKNQCACIALKLVNHYMRNGLIFRDDSDGIPSIGNGYVDEWIELPELKTPD